LVVGLGVGFGFGFGVGLGFGVGVGFAVVAGFGAGLVVVGSGVGLSVGVGAGADDAGALVDRVAVGAGVAPGGTVPVGPCAEGLGLPTAADVVGCEVGPAPATTGVPRPGTQDPHPASSTAAAVSAAAALAVRVVVVRPISCHSLSCSVRVHQPPTRRHLRGLRQSTRRS
jgi:hypothetical protein